MICNTEESKSQEAITKTRNLESTKSISFFFAFSPFRAFVINPYFFYSSLKRDLRFAPNDFAGIGIEELNAEVGKKEKVERRASEQR